jgi:HTH-type transcriptional regulator / antitoxin HigA
MKFAVVKEKTQHQEYLARIEELVTKDPSSNSDEGRELELLALLVEDYERTVFPFENPDPVEAIQFRMHEQGLKQVDLVPYFGSRSRVSEFLSRQRPLTLSMVRHISTGLGIPTEILLQESVDKRATQSAEVSAELDWTKFPVKEMVNRGWIAASKKKSELELSYIAVKAYIEKTLGGATSGVLARRTIRGDAFSWPAEYALLAWQARVLEKASTDKTTQGKKFELKLLSDDFLKKLVKLSQDENGPEKAVMALGDIGVAVIFEEHLAKTKLDGGAMLAANGNPIVGLTLRFDRIDNFWFTLLHELAHVRMHLSNPGDVFLDRLFDKKSTEEVEKEADRFARDFLISRSAWKSSSVRQMPTKSGIISFAREIGIHPAIVAGRLQKEQENYLIFTDMVGQGAIRNKFRT